MIARKELANAIRVLSMDAVQRANSGHPGMPMGMADIAEVLWNDFLRHNPRDPFWFDRDRFVLSNGHGSMLLYSALHLSGYDLDMQEVKNFRQLHSKTPGHPEYGLTPGVETTTGPLGQGLANAVGMALAEKILAAEFNREGHEIIDHYTYVFLGDGCLMEGISHEVSSLAGTLGLGKLICFYDDNGISIDGQVDKWFTDDTAARFEAYGWQVIRNIDGHDAQAIEDAIVKSRAVQDKPSLLCCQTTIACGAPNLYGSSKSHGAPLGEEEVAGTRKALNWSHAPFDIPDDIYAGWNAEQKGAGLQDEWRRKWEDYKVTYPDLAVELSRRIHADFPAGFEEKSWALIREVDNEAKDMATRKASKSALDGYAPMLPELIGGSADLTGSNSTWHAKAKTISQTDFNANYLHYGVREFGMAGIMNGMSLHGGLIPYGGTFLVFSDYARNALRLASLMGIRNLFVFTHDSIGVGEDGPTHQPVEQLASLRLIPNLDVWRPCDAVETAVAWKCGLERQNGPSALVLSRQGLKHQQRDPETVYNIRHGAYILVEPEEHPEAIIIATGSEVNLAVDAQKELASQGHQVRVVSMPCVEVFERQDEGYRALVLPEQVPARVVIEAGCTASWYKYAGSKGKVIGLDRYGESAPGGQLFEYFGFSSENVVLAVKEVLSSE